MKIIKVEFIVACLSGLAIAEITVNSDNSLIRKSDYENVRIESEKQMGQLGNYDFLLFYPDGSRKTVIGLKFDPEGGGAKIIYTDLITKAYKILGAPEVKNLYSLITSIENKAVSESKRPPDAYAYLYWKNPPNEPSDDKWRWKSLKIDLPRDEEFENKELNQIFDICYPGNRKAERKRFEELENSVK